MSKDNQKYVQLGAFATPPLIEALRPNEVFVFGSNLQGHHNGGAARTALEKFGAQYGVGVGLQGQSYAIPTMQGGVETIKPYVEEFTEFARKNQQLKFFVTRIGCGIAGFKDEEIAPLFRQAMNLPNVLLPGSFVKILSKDYLGEDHLTHLYGITKTFADIVMYRNNESPIHSPQEAFDTLADFFQRITDYGDEEAFTAIRILHNVLDEKMFNDKGLDIDALRSAVFDFDHFSENAFMAYGNYCREKLVNLIAYLNDFRRYNNADDILSDLRKADVFNFSHCGPIDHNYYFSVPNYPIYFFKDAILKKWSELAPNGVLDNGLLKQYMFENHEKAVKELGLEGAIARDYVVDSPCHPEVFRPKEIGSGPVYAKTDGRFNRSCGEGKGPNRIPHLLEGTVADKLLHDDPNYVYRNNFYLPVNDVTLPVYWSLGLIAEKIHFDSFDEKSKFIWEQKKA